MDAFAERDITDTLRKACESRTTLTIAHRLSSIIHCDLIIVMEQGHVVEQGTHEDLLLNSNGVYARMWKVQNNQTPSKILKSRSQSSSDRETVTAADGYDDITIENSTFLLNTLSTNIDTAEAPYLYSTDRSS